MFSGIVEERARVHEVRMQQGVARLIIHSGLDHTTTAVGDSVAISGVCLTVVDKNTIKEERRTTTLLSFDVVAETLRRTTLHAVKAGEYINVERSLMYGDRVHGHLVSGHVDGVGRVKRKVREHDGSWRFLISYPPSLLPFIAEKGSIAVAGVSLTVGEVSSEGFSVYLIPHTLEVTTFGSATIGTTVNLEVDILARYLVAKESAPVNAAV